jgi:choline dehydrogenase-like flavoprotein
MPIHRPADPCYDVVIVGARAAGAATAHLLARSGLRVLLVDRGRYGTDTLSTHALMRGGVLQLSRWGLLEKIIAAGTPPVRRATFRYADAVVPVTIKPSFRLDACAPRGTVLDRSWSTPAAASGADFGGVAGPTGLRPPRGRHRRRPDAGRPGVPGPGPTSLA